MTKSQGTAFNINTLYESARSGSKPAERELLEHLNVSFRLFAQRRIWNEQDAEEVVQEALLTISTNYGAMAFETSFAAWAYKVLQNKILDHVKKKRTRQALADQIDDSKVHASAVGHDPELRERLINCFKKLSDTNLRHARILNLHYQGYTTEEICQKLKVTSGNFYVLLSRARTALETCLQKGDIE